MSFLRTDVTAVCLHDNFILAGIGRSVFVFNKTTCQFIKKLPALVGQKVHGFAAKGGNIAASGGKQIAIISLTEVYGTPENELLVKIICHLQCDDWILHTIWTNEDTVAALTAHNVVQVWNIKTHGQLQQYSGEDNSILYSGLLEQLEDDLLVLAGTVFSQVIVHRCGSRRRLQVLEGHKGVIFSIAWDSTKEIIATTSDDRSVRTWSPNCETKLSPKHKEYWESCNMVCRHVVYGHLSRVMGCTITSSIIVSVGEDSNVCFWDLSGKLLKKVNSHQNGCIWSLHSDSSYVVTGGSDCGVVLHPLSLALDCQRDTLIGLGTPKRIMFSARGNIVAYLATDKLCYFDAESQWHEVATYDSTYKMMALSSCKQLLAIVDASGNLDVFIENCKNAPHLNKLLFRKLDVGKICSLHWAGNRFLVVCSADGNITVTSSDCERLRSFLLPSCKERWLTAAAVNASQDIFVVGDRCGNIHFFRKDERHPMRTLRKVHGNYGPTTITWRENSVFSTGRDGTIKYFSVKKCDEEYEIKMMHQLNLPFQWVERLMDGLVCGFNERNFIVHSLKDGRSMIDVACGGGHRAWDIRRYFAKTNDRFKEFIKFIYVKDSVIQTAIFDIDMTTSKTVVSGTHVKEINCLERFIIEDCLDDGEILKGVFFVAGGEDTTIRLSSYEPNSNYFCDRLIFKELSSVRSIALYRLNDKEILLVSGGGRAKISIRVIRFIRSGQKFDLEAENLVEYQIKDSNKRKGNTSWKSDLDVDPETRIMSLQIMNINNRYIILAGCSDSILRIYNYDHREVSFEPIGQINYHKTCILIVRHCEVSGLVFTATTTGEIAIWDFSFLTVEEIDETEPILKLNVRRSGINSLIVKRTNDYWLLATGGDDNSVHLVLLKLKEKDDYSSIFEVSRWSESGWHNAQVTGLKFVDDWLITASIDQRITISKVSIQDDVVDCEFVEQLYTDVADVQGLEVSDRTGDTVDLCVYGKGIEVVNVKIA